MAAAPGCSSSGDTVPLGDRAEALAERLAGWRQVLVRLDSALLWENPAALGGLFGCVTLAFVLLGWLQPSLLTVAAVLCLAAAVCDLAVPQVSQLAFGCDWTPANERSFSRLCAGIVAASDCGRGLVCRLFRLRRDKPQLFVCVALPALLCVAFVGQKVNNLFLAYVCCLLLLLWPGASQHGVLQRAASDACAVVRQRLRGSALKDK